MKLRIDNDSMLDDFFEDTCLLGIVAPMEQYKFCWNLNHLTNFNFRIDHNLEIPMIKKGRKYFFSVYQYKEPNTTTIHYIYNNHHDGEFLLPEFRHLDFLWLLRDETMEKRDLVGLIEVVKTIPVVQMVTELTQEKIKNKQHLVL